MKRKEFLSTSFKIFSLPLLDKLFPKIRSYSIENILHEYLPVNFTRDGLNLSPPLYSILLYKLTQEKGFSPDSYGLGGMIHKFEEKVAKALGKESAIFMPTGTLANHIALRQHCIRKKRAIVQYESHINRDSGDCVSNLSGINLITLGKTKVIFSLNELYEVLEDSRSGKVDTPVGAISLETPVRRKNLQRIPFKILKQITKIGKENNISLHLDGARLFIDSFFSGKDVKEYTKLFDTVYLSLHKSFSSIAGAVLAGPKKIISGLHNERRMFGGGLPSSWENVAIANYFFDNYQKRYREARKRFDFFRKLIEKSGDFQIKEFPNGSSVFKLKILSNFNKKRFREKLLKKEILIPQWSDKFKSYLIKMNDSLVYNDMEWLAEQFIKALK